MLKSSQAKAPAWQSYTSVPKHISKGLKVKLQKARDTRPPDSKASPSSPHETLQGSTLCISGLLNSTPTFPFLFLAAALGDFITPFCDCQSVRRTWVRKLKLYTTLQLAHNQAQGFLRCWGGARQTDREKWNICGQELRIFVEDLQHRHSHS